MTTVPEHRLLAVFAHPDDETIAAGGYLALAAVAGVDVSVVTCTRGERGEVIAPELAELAGDERALAYYREGELSAALAELGARRHLFLDQVPGLKQSRPSRFRDSGMAWLRPGIAGPAPDAGPYAFTAVDVELAARLLAVVIRHLRPTAVLTEEPGGGYGHPDHIHVHRVTMRAVELAATAELPPSPEEPDPLAGLPTWQVPSVLWVAQDEDATRAGLRELAQYVARHGAPTGADGAALTVPDPEAELPGIAVPADQIGATLDARPVTDRLFAALRAHGSQVQAVREIADAEHIVGHLALSNGSLMPVAGRVYLRPAPGYDVADLAAALARGPAAPAEHDGTTTASPHGSGTPGDATGETTTAGPPVIGAPGVSAGWSEQDIPAPPAGEGSGSRRHGGGSEGEDGVREDGVREDRVREGGGREGGVREGGEGEGSGSRRQGGWGLLLLALAVGVVMALLGTVVHRFAVEGWPAGIVVALVGIFAGAVAARAFGGGSGLTVATLAVVVTTQAMAFLRPGGDVLVTDELISYLWLFGAPITCFLVLLLPRWWFADRPRESRVRS